MLRKRICRGFIFAALFAALFAGGSALTWGADLPVTVAAAPTSGPAQSSGPAQNPAGGAPTSVAPSGDDTFLLTIFLKHDESKPLPKINEQLREQGFFKAFPPPGIEVVSWYVMMGVGQVVTLRVPASRLREVNRAIENTAWGGYRTEFYPTYDYKAAAEQMRASGAK
ncbi:hypothetical protein [Burkholderia sp. L27(2015)]|uniref:hypothetical protein n=1 Tax=Burkholderia sp. L27(2015) TaxID=1641858 RepID=UPI0020B11BCD|nr:hypothetical protein [Burkholderia sp. L27(2015)]